VYGEPHFHAYYAANILPGNVHHFEFRSFIFALFFDGKVICKTT
jgi:hypothetical protein